MQYILHRFLFLFELLIIHQWSKKTLFRNFSTNTDSNLRSSCVEYFTVFSKLQCTHIFEWNYVGERLKDYIGEFETTSLTSLFLFQPSNNFWFNSLTLKTMRHKNTVEWSLINSAAGWLSATYAREFRYLECCTGTSWDLIHSTTIHRAYFWR